MKKIILMATVALVVVFVLSACSKEKIDHSLAGTEWEYIGATGRAVSKFVDDDDVIQQVYSLEGVLELTFAATYEYDHPAVTIYHGDGSVSTAKVAGETLIYTDDYGVTVWDRIKP